MKKILLRLIVAATLSAAAARANSIEVMSGQNASTLDLKVSGKITKETGIFVRSRTTTDYDNRTGHFLLADISYTLGAGLDAVMETQAAAKVVPRVGVQYSRRIGELSLYGMMSGTTMDGGNAELTLQQNYTPKVSPKVHLVVDMEEVTNDGKQHNYSLQRGRISLGINGWQFGAAADAMEIGEELTLDYNIGMFGSTKF